jgi:hypothetical protein
MSLNQLTVPQAMSAVLTENDVRTIPRVPDNPRSEDGLRDLSANKVLTADPVRAICRRTDGGLLDKSRYSRSGVVNRFKDH